MAGRVALPDSFKKLPADDNWKEVKANVPGKKGNSLNSTTKRNTYRAVVDLARVNQSMAGHKLDGCCCAGVRKTAIPNLVIGGY